MCLSNTYNDRSCFIGNESASDFHTKPICTNTYVQEERKWSRLISFIGNLKLKQNLYQWVNNSEVSGTQKKSIRNLASMLSRGNLKKKSKKKIM